MRSWAVSAQALVLLTPGVEMRMQIHSGPEEGAVRLGRCMRYYPWSISLGKKVKAEVNNGTWEIPGSAAAQLSWLLIGSLSDAVMCHYSFGDSNQLKC